MSTAIDKRDRAFDSEKNKRFFALQGANVAGFVCDNGPLRGKGMRWGNTEDGKTILKKPTAIMNIAPRPKIEGDEFYHYPYHFYHVVNDYFKYQYSFKEVDENNIAVYHMPGCNF